MTDTVRAIEQGNSDSAHDSAHSERFEELENSGRGADVVAAGVAEAAVLSPAGRPPQLNAVKTGTRSVAVTNLLAPARNAIEEHVITDLGGDSDGLPTTPGRLVQAFSETTLMRQSLFTRMEGEPLTNKGKARAMFAAYLQLLDRETKLA